MNSSPSPWLRAPQECPCKTRQAHSHRTARGPISSRLKAGARPPEASDQRRAREQRSGTSAGPSASRLIRYGDRADIDLWIGPSIALKHPDVGHRSIRGGHVIQVGLATETLSVPRWRPAMDTSCRTTGCAGRLDLRDASDQFASTSPRARATCPVCGVDYEVAFNAGRIAKVVRLDSDDTPTQSTSYEHAHEGPPAERREPLRNSNVVGGVGIRAEEAPAQTQKPAQGIPTSLLTNAGHSLAAEVEQVPTPPTRGQSPSCEPIDRLRPAPHTSRVKVLIVAGALLAGLITVAVSQVGSHHGNISDVVAQSCVVEGSGAQATVLVVNHGSGTASYLFDVVFSQNQSALVGVPLHTTALPAGSSATLHADAGSIDTSKAVACTIANQQRLAGG